MRKVVSYSAQYGQGPAAGLDALDRAARLAGDSALDN
jgi:hypothetical protein